jgi:hypothetical protein
MVSFAVGVASSRKFIVTSDSDISRHIAPLESIHHHHSFISNLSDDRSTASSKTIPPLNAI